MKALIRRQLKATIIWAHTDLGRGSSTFGAEALSIAAGYRYRKNMYRSDYILKPILLVITVLLVVLALQPLFVPATRVLAQTARFDHIMIVSTGFLYKGQQGLLVMDRRNANVWFFPKVNDTFHDPVFIMRLPFDKIDQAPTQ